MKGEAQDIHKSGGASINQLFQDCVDEIQSLIFDFYSPLLSKFHRSFLSPAALNISGKK